MRLMICQLVLAISILSCQSLLAKPGDVPPDFIWKSLVKAKAASKNLRFITIERRYQSLLIDTAKNIEIAQFGNMQASFESNLSEIRDQSLFISKVSLSSNSPLVVEVSKKVDADHSEVVRKIVFDFKNFAIRTTVTGQLVIGAYTGDVLLELKAEYKNVNSPKARPTFSVTHFEWTPPYNEALKTTSMYELQPKYLMIERSKKNKGIYWTQNSPNSESNFYYSGTKTAITSTGKINLLLERSFSAEGGVSCFFAVR